MTKPKLSIAFSTAILLVLIWMAWEAANFQELASYFPLYISLFAIVLVSIDLIKQIRNLVVSDSDGENSEINRKEALAVVKYILWFFGYFILIITIGFLVGTTVFLLLFLILETKFKIVKAVITTAITLAVILALGEIMGLRWIVGIFGI